MTLGNLAEARRSEPFRSEQFLGRFVVLFHACVHFLHTCTIETSERIFQKQLRYASPPVGLPYCDVVHVTNASLKRLQHDQPDGPPFRRRGSDHLYVPKGPLRSSQVPSVEALFEYPLEALPLTQGDVH